MTHLLKARLPGALVALGVSAFALASCGGGGGYTAPSPGGGGAGGPSSAPTSSSSASSSPSTSPTGTASPKSTQTPSPRPTSTSTPRQTPAPTPTPTVAPLACAAEKVPGTYTTLNALGTVTGSTFSLVQGVWFRDSVTPATPAPTPTISPTASPAPTPSTTPTPQPIYIYEGTYTVIVNGKTETNGCAVVVTSQDGSLLRGSTTNAATDEFPTFNQDVNQTLVGTGGISSLTIMNLSSRGGNGTFKLSDQSTGTVTLTSRQSSTFSTLRRQLKLRQQGPHAGPF